MLSTIDQGRGANLTNSSQTPGRVSSFRQPSGNVPSGAMGRVNSTPTDVSHPSKVRTAFRYLGLGLLGAAAAPPVIAGATPLAAVVVTAAAVAGTKYAAEKTVAGTKYAAGKTVAGTNAIAHMSAAATVGVILVGGAIVANTAFATVRGTGAVLQTLGGLMKNPKDTLRELKQAAGDLCRGVKEKIDLARKAKRVRDAATKILPGYRRGNIGHWLKSLTGRHAPVEVEKTTAYRQFEALTDEAKTGIQETAHLARLAYSGITTERGLREGFVQLQKTDDLPEALRDFYNEKTGLINMPSGFKAFVAKKGDAIHLAFAGSEFGLRLLGSDREGTYQADYLQRFGLYSPMYRDAVAVTKLFKDKLSNDASLHLSGHSLGGGLAQFAAAANEVSATCFNAAGMSAGSLAMLGQKKVNQAAGNITHIRVKGDPVSDGGGGRLGPVQINAKGTEIGTVITLDHPGSGGSATAHFMQTVHDALEKAATTPAASE